MTGWEEFTGRMARGSFGDPTVRITADGLFYVNSPAARLLGDATRVMLLWDAERRRIGLRATERGNSHSYAVSSMQGAGARKIWGIAFLRYYGLLDLCGQRFPAHLEDDVLVVPLAPATDAGTAVRS